MSTNHKNIIFEEIIKIAKEFNISKIVLFGSRARGDNKPKSDYDFAFFSDNDIKTQMGLISTFIEDIETLHKIDVVFIDENTNKELLHNIYNEGVTVYEQPEK